MVSKRTVRKFTEGNELLLISLLLMGALFPFSGERLSRFPALVDWRTIGTLTGLLLTTTAMKESRFFSHLARGILQRISRERRLALALVVTSALLSMLLTNDIALFIVVPLTLSFEELTGNNFLRLIIFEALAVNVGSTLTPIGNPQNIFLWHRWGISFPHFVWEMFPLFLLQIVVLLLFTRFAFPDVPLPHRVSPRNAVNRKLFLLSAALFLLFLVSVELRFLYPTLVAILLVYLLAYRGIFRHTDWGLIVLFILLFVDVHLLARLSPVSRLFAPLFRQSQCWQFFGAVVTAQCLSNVPAAILLSKFSHQWRLIAYAVNVGGNGLVIASFANLIALRMSRSRGKLAQFHRYSVPFLLVTLVAAAGLFFCG